MSGRKRHLVVDTLGLVHAVVVHAASVQDRDGARLVLGKLRGKAPRLQLLGADGGYAGKLLDWVREQCGWALAVVKRSDEAAGCPGLPKRWIVERTFGWRGRFRRLSKDYEALPESSEAWITIALISLMGRRLAPG